MTMRQPANRSAVEVMRTVVRVGVVSCADLEGGQVRRVIQVLGIAAGLLLDTSVRSRNRRDGRTSDKHVTSRLPVVLFVIGAVLLVLSSL